jgi:hypothetical protein
VNPPVAPAAAALTCVAVIEPSECVVPCTITMSPGWIAPALVEAVRLIFERQARTFGS